MRLILIRHEETEHTLRHIIAGRMSCRGLTERGFKQVQLLAQRFATTGEVNDSRSLLCSPVLRAQQTAEVLARTLPVGAIEQNCDLCELHPGEADGLSWETYRATYGAFDLLASPTRAFVPGVECWLEFIERVRATLERLAARFAGQTVVAVTHAGFIVASVLVLFDIPQPGTGTRMDPCYTSLPEGHAPRATWRLLRFNDTAHVTDRSVYD